MVCRYIRRHAAVNGLPPRNIPVSVLAVPDPPFAVATTPVTLAAVPVVF